MFIVVLSFPVAASIILHAAESSDLHTVSQPSRLHSGLFGEVLMCNQTPMDQRISSSLETYISVYFK